MVYLIGEKRRPALAKGAFWKAATGKKYTTGDMQSMFGLTNKGLFHYEKKGIVAPTRLNNQYRVFTMEDCSRFFMSRIYRELGFSLDRVRRACGAGPRPK